MHDHEYKTCGVCGQRHEIFEAHTCFSDYPESTQKLLTELVASEAPEWIVEAAKTGLYNDYDSEIPDPITQLVRDALKAGLPKISQRAKDGKYDGTTAESKAWMEREGKSLLTPDEYKALFGEG